MAGMMILNQDLKEFVQSLKDNNVRYLVVGGYAVAMHGHPRYTKDIDIWLDMTPRNAHLTLKALEDFGFGSLDLEDEDFLDPGQIIQLGYPPNRIDLLTSIEGMNFQECYDSRLEVEISGVSVNFIDLENLKKTKRIAGRYQDLADLDSLK